MKKLNRKKQERHARSEAIIDIAEQIIDEKGFDNATMDEIAERTGIAKGTLYLHFKSKSSLYLAICERGSEKLNRELGKVLLQDVPGIEMIERLGKVYLEFIQNNRVYFNAFNYYEGILEEDPEDEQERIERCEENAGEAMTYIVRALQIGMHDGSIRDTFDPKELGVIIWGASKGVMHTAYMSEKSRRMKLFEEVAFTVESLTENFIRLVGTGIQSDDYQSKK